MNKNGVLNVIYGIAAFIAFVSAVALLYGAIELLCNTTFYNREDIGGDDSYVWQYSPSNTFHSFQAPFGWFLLLTAIAAIAGCVCALFAVFGKRTAVKRVSFCMVCAVVVAIIIFLIAGMGVWNTEYQSFWDEDHIYNGGYPAIISYSSSFVIYSAYMTSMVQLLAVFAVIAGVLIYRAVTLRKAGRGGESAFSDGQAERVANE